MSIGPPPPQMRRVQAFGVVIVDALVKVGSEAVPGPFRSTVLLSLVEHSLVVGQPGELVER